MSLIKVYRQCGLLMVAETVSLGVLSLPAAVAGLGLVPYVHRHDTVYGSN